ncbi:MAG: Cation transporter/ATPase, N-terminus, partial [Chloroflexota bacterium]|nr:Cation transporter/ATPase, N-terminus [Chloroflexota bacterium]
MLRRCAMMGAMADSPMPEVGDAHARPAEEVARALGVDRGVGLATDDVSRRAALSGPNALAPAERESVLTMIREAATEPFVLLLLGAGLLAVVLGEVR